MDYSTEGFFILERSKSFTASKTSGSSVLMRFNLVVFESLDMQGTNVHIPQHSTAHDVMVQNSIFHRNNKANTIFSVLYNVIKNP